MPDVCKIACRSETGALHAALTKGLVLEFAPIKVIRNLLFGFCAAATQGPSICQPPCRPPQRPPCNQDPSAPHARRDHRQCHPDTAFGRFSR